jgi:hypothetical protein
VRCEPLALFPRTTWAYLEKGGDAALLERATGQLPDGGDPAAAGAHRRALGAAHSALMGAPGGGARAESDDPWVEALWRGAPPPLESILGAGLPLYEPLFARLQLYPDGDEKKRRGR